MQKPLAKPNHFSPPHIDRSSVSAPRSGVTSPGWVVLLGNVRVHRTTGQRWRTHLMVVMVIVGLTFIGNYTFSENRLSAPSLFRADAEITTQVALPQIEQNERPFMLFNDVPPVEVDLVQVNPIQETIIPDRSVTSVEAPDVLEIRSYIVQSGDTIYGIAQEMGLAPETVMWANQRIENSPDLLTVGEELTILPVDGVYHQVGGGDTLAGIAATFKVDVESIVTFPLNELEPDNPIIVPGEWLVVPGGIKPYEPKYVSVASVSAPEDALRGTGSFQWPASGSITQEFWNRHRALDIGAWIGAPIYAADGGYVTTAQWDDSGYGRVVIVDHGNGFKTLYAHLSTFYVAPGDEVAQGQQIGEMGSSGNSTGPHLHFEVIKDGVQRNPWGFLGN